MLQAIRDKAQGWIAWAIVILISIPFALWGIQEYLNVDSNPVVATVNGSDIKERDLEQQVRQYRETLRASLGEAFNEEVFDEETLRRQALDSMVDDRIMLQAADDWNLRISDQQLNAFVHSIPAFQRDGRFDQGLYTATVRNSGQSEAGFELAVRRDLLLQQMREGVLTSAFVTDREVVERVALTDETRDIRYMTIPAASFNDVSRISDDSAQRHYEANRAEYRVPERVKLRYIELTRDVLLPLVEVDDEKLREYFDTHQRDFVSPESRKVRHILVAVPETADEQQLAAVEQKAQDIRQQILDGAAFAELATTHSEDPGSAANGGDLGWVSKGIMVEAFEQSAFSLPVGQVSAPVRSPFGFHLIEVTEVRGGGRAGYADVRDKVEKAYRQLEAENLYYDYAERLANEAYESPDNLEGAAQSLGLQLRNTGWVTRSGGLPPAIDVPKVVNAAFSEDVLVQGHNSDVIEVDAEHAVVLRVSEHEAETVKPFEVVKDEVRLAAAAAQASEAAVAAGQEAISSLSSGGDMRALAQTRQWTFSEHAKVRRGNDSIVAEVLDTSFELKPPAAGTSSFGGVVTAEGDYVVVAVDRVTAGKADDLDESRRQATRSRATGLLGRAEADSMIDALRARATVERL